MVEVRYGKYWIVADLVGKRVAEAREECQPLLDLPSCTRAILNGQPVKKNMEPNLKLNECDELCFAVVSEQEGRDVSSAPQVWSALVPTGRVTARRFSQN